MSDAAKEIEIAWKMSEAPLPEVTDTLDTSGLFCPEPVMLLHAKMKGIAAGAVLEVIATDPATQRDIPKFCHFLGHTLVHQESDATRFRYLLQKA